MNNLSRVISEILTPVKELLSNRTIRICSYVLLASTVCFLVFFAIWRPAFILYFVLCAGVVIVVDLILYWILQHAARESGRPSSLLAIGRIFFYIFLVITALLPLCLSFLGIVVYPYFNSSNIFDIKNWGIVLPGTPLFLGSFLALWWIWSKIHVLLYYKKDYLLILRSFGFDSKEDAILPVLQRISMPIMKIGNPTEIIPKGDADTFYLPASDWKKQLNYYIDAAKYVFGVVDSTPGLLWELFYHIDQADKFIYYIHSYSDANDLLKTRHASWMDKTALMFGLVYLSAQHPSDRVAFSISSYRLCYGSIEDILEWVVIGKTSSRLKTVPFSHSWNYLLPNNQHSIVDSTYNKRLSMANNVTRNVTFGFKRTAGILFYGIMLVAGAINMLGSIVLFIVALQGKIHILAALMGSVFSVPVGFYVFKESLLWFRTLRKRK